MNLAIEIKLATDGLTTTYGAEVDRSRYCRIVKGLLSESLEARYEPRADVESYDLSVKTASAVSTRVYVTTEEEDGATVEGPEVEVRWIEEELRRIECRTETMDRVARECL